MNNVTPQIMYGTAWKEELTADCVFHALECGYRALDTANQRKHYHEEGVGQGLLEAYRKLKLKREDLFLQTKFTYIHGQDHRLPYDPEAPLRTQVEQSFASSLEHLHTDYVDSYVLHGPTHTSGLSEEDWQTWAAMETLYREKKTLALGVSNISASQLQELYEGAEVKPQFVQNRCYAQIHWDIPVRDYCRRNNIAYQGFSLLTASRSFFGGEVHQISGRNVPQLRYPSDRADLLAMVHPKLAAVFEDTGLTPQELIFQYAKQTDIIPLVGPRTVENMKANLNAKESLLNPQQIELIEHIALLH